MNREIKFRFFWKNQMRYGAYLMLPSMVQFIPNATGEYKQVELLDGFLMQYTGLKDKNGKEIYEGDILDFGYPATSRYDPDDDTFRLPIKVTIDFHGGAFWFTGEGYTDCNWHFYNSEDREVIGNIYETRHLLNKE